MSLGSESFPATDPSGFALNVLSVLMMYGPAYLANTGAMLCGYWLPKKFGISNHKIDGGKVHSDGNRLLGDGKSWEGLFGGAIFAGLLTLLVHILWQGRAAPAGRPFIDPVSWADAGDWFWIGGESGAAFLIGASLGFACMLGDSFGSYIKRRRGLKREGETSSRAPLLDTIPFALAIFISAFLLFPDQIITHSDLRPAILGILILTPLIHRAFNILGHRLGLKSVPY